MSEVYEQGTRKPSWLKIKLHDGPGYAEVAGVLGENSLHTICTSGKCPNQAECWGRRTATFMIGGDICTRSCRFCATKTGRPLPLDSTEPAKVARSVNVMGLRYCVLTSVDRDDLPDGGANHWAETVREIRKTNPGTKIELLIPDFDGDPALLDIVVAAGADVTGHNIETVERITPQVRSRARYRTSLEVLKYLAGKGVVTKSGLMVGLGETQEEVLATMDDLAGAGCRILTIGQYLQPTRGHFPVAEYIHPDIFLFYKNEALKRGFAHVESSPLTRSSYMADRAAEAASKRLDVIDMGTVEYAEAWDVQRELFDGLIKDKEEKHLPHYLMLCEHPHVYTLGKSGVEANLLVDGAFLDSIGATYYKTDRGGDITYHGYGQLVGYPIMDLERLGMGLKEYIHTLEESIIRTVADYGIEAGRLEGAAGVWLDADKPSARKICAIGVRSSRYVTMHGFALNANTDLRYFSYINPCGFVDKGVTSIAAETGREVDFGELRRRYEAHFRELFGLK